MGGLVSQPTGPVTMLAPGFLVDGKLPEFGRVPALGEDTDKIFAEFGLTGSDGKAG